MNLKHEVSYEPANGLFAVATIARDPADINARALGHHDLLRFHALGTRRGAIDVPPKLTHLNPKIMGLNYLASFVLPRFRHEAFRFRLHPWFDHWAGQFVVPGDHIISSFGFTNRTFRKVRAGGGKTFYSAGNSHPNCLWALVEEEHRRWNCPYPPYARFQHKRVLEMMPLVDYVLSPSTFVTESFIAEGFSREQILRNFYPVDLSCFAPRKGPRPKDRPLSVITTGALTLRKGTPYLFDAFRIVLKKVPNARLLLTNDVMDSMAPVMAKYNDLPIDWAPALPHAQLGERLRSADIFSMPSIEDGFGRTVTEALACGLPVIVTPNTGAADFVRPGVNGEIVPIRNAQAIADAILKWADRILTNPDLPPVTLDASELSYEAFESEFLEQLANRGMIKRKGEKLRSKAVEA